MGRSRISLSPFKSTYVQRRENLTPSRRRKTMFISPYPRILAPRNMRHSQYLSGKRTCFIVLIREYYLIELRNRINISMDNDLVSLSVAEGISSQGCENIPEFRWADTLLRCPYPERYHLAETRECTSISMAKERVSVSPCRKDQLIEMREHTSISIGKDLVPLSLGRRHYLTEMR